MTFRISIVEILSSRSFLWLALLLGGLYLSLPSWAVGEPVSAPKSWAHAYETPEIQFPAQDSPWLSATLGRHPQWLQYVLNKVFKWDPQDQPPSLTGPCRTSNFVDALIQSTSPQHKTEVFNNYHKNCEDQYVKGPLLNAWQAFRLFTMSYNPDDHPFQHRVVINLPDGKKIRGLLALKDNKKRPFVILRMGIAGNIEEAFAERFFYYQLFERGLFHFLMIENMTSPDFIHNNKSLEFGGLAESYQNMWLAQILRSEQQPLSRLVQSLHLVGVSLGGQGVLTTSWLAPYQSNPEIYQSYLALCPLVNLKPTFDYLFKTGWRRLPVQIWAHSRFAEIQQFRPELFETYFDLPHRILEAVTETYQRPQASLFQVQEPDFVARNSDFLSLHNLSDWPVEKRKPYWIWVTNEDNIVPVHLNTDALKGVEPVRIPVGDHCSFPASWDGRMTQAMFRGHILGSTDFQYQSKSRTLDVDPNHHWDFYNVEPPQEDGQLKVELRSDKGHKVTFLMSLADLDFHFQSTHLAEAEKRMIRRWLSTNLIFKPGPEGRGMTVSWPFVTQ